MPTENKITQVRPDSKFEKYTPFTEEQLQVWEYMFSLANHLLDHESEIISNEHPFKRASWISITGNPGTGKSFLIEAFINYLQEQQLNQEPTDIAPNLTNRIYLSRSNFTTDNMTFAEDYDKKPIIIIDDIFVEHQNVDTLHERTDLAALFNFMKHIYEERCLVISTCNFSFIEQIFPMLEPLDKTGRYMSRFSELMSNLGEQQLTGPDSRQIPSEPYNGNLNEHSDDKFSLFE